MVIDADFITYARSLGNIPDAVTDDLLNPHLRAGVRDAEKRLGRVITSDATDEDYREAAACFGIAHAIPSLNTFFLQGAGSVARQVDEMNDFVFSSPGDWSRMQESWRKRADEILGQRGISFSIGTVTRPEE